MFVVKLACAEGHVFDGWFDHHADVDDQLAAGDMRCPTCGDAHVAKRPSFAAIARSTASSSTPASSRAGGAPPKLPLDVQRALSRILRTVRAHGEDVGPAFAETALAIQRGEQEGRLIYGQSTPAEERQLVDEGVSFAKIPVPEIDEN